MVAERHHRASFSFVHCSGVVVVDEASVTLTEEQADIRREVYERDEEGGV